MYLVVDDGGGDEGRVEDDCELAAAVGRVLRAVRLVVARERGELAPALGRQAEADGEVAGRGLALDGGGLKVLAGDARLSGTRDEVRRVRAIAVVLQHEAVASVGDLEAGDAGRVAGTARDLGPVRRAGIAVGLLLVAFGGDVLGKELRDELVVLRMRQAELQERRALEGRLGGLAHLFVYAGELDEEPVVLHALNDRLVRAHRVDAAADDRHDAVVAADERLLDLLLHGAGRVCDRRIRRDY